MNTKIYTPEQAKQHKEAERQRKVKQTASLRQRMHDAAERKELIAELKAMGLWEVGA